MDVIDQDKVKKLAARIHEFEHEAGESFADYFMATNKVKPVSWGFWLLGKGFIERANEILDIIEEGKTPDQELMFQAYSQHMDTDSVSNEAFHREYDKDILLIAEFLCSTNIYQRRVAAFFEQVDSGEGY